MAQGVHSRNSITDRKALKASWFRRLIGFRKRGVKTTVSVDPPSILAGATGTVDVTIANLSTTRRFQRLVWIPAALLEAGLQVASVAVQATNTARITFRNVSAETINGDARDWDIYLFDGSL